MTFNQLFHATNPERSRFLNGLFSLFARDIITCWAGDPQAPYTSLGKPTLRQAGPSRGSPVDFAFQDRRKKQVFAVVMYCDPLDDAPLSSPAQIDQLASTRTFAAFLEAAHNPSLYSLAVRGDDFPAAGSILIWGSIESKKTRAIVRKACAFHDLLSVEDIIRDLLAWRNREFQMLLDRRATWCHDLFREIRQIK